MQSQGKKMKEKFVAMGAMSLVLSMPVVDTVYAEESIVITPTTTSEKTVSVATAARRSRERG
jgi:hypothetical protein